MRHAYILIFILITSLTSGCLLLRKQQKVTYISSTLEIERISKNTFLHRSFLVTEKWGKFPCNGLVYINDKEAIVFDTPVSDSVSAELIAWIENKKNVKVKHVVINHFHDDCLGGLAAFHSKNIPSYASELTCALAREDSVNNPVVPQNAFERQLTLNVGDGKVTNMYFGEGHTKDNIVSYIPSEKLLFGGCLIKAKKAGKGNLADANTEEWSATVRKVKDFFPNAKYVIPGHGQYGDTSLLGYTIALFGHQ